MQIQLELESTGLLVEKLAVVDTVTLNEVAVF
jgi:hypothetical protein